MEYVDGMTLKQLASTFFTPDTVLQLIYQILKVVQYLHEHNVCHNDLNQSNIMISRAGHMKIIDFGQSKANLANAKNKISKEQAFKWTDECKDSRKLHELVHSLTGSV